MYAFFTGLRLHSIDAEVVGNKGGNLESVYAHRFSLAIQQNGKRLFCGISFTTTAQIYVGVVMEIRIVIE